MKSRLPLLALLGLGCSGAHPDREGARLVVLYTACTVNKSFLSPYGKGTGGFTPAFQALADEGLVFLRHETESGQSGISFASLYSGQQADKHGVYRHPRRLSEKTYLVSEAFADAGYDTYFWSGQPMASAKLGYGQGVPEEHVFDRVLRFGAMPERFDEEYLRGVTGNDGNLRPILERLRSDPDYRAYLQVNLTITHEPYDRYVSPEQIWEFCQAFPEHSKGVRQEQIPPYLEIYRSHRQELNWDFDNTVAKLHLSRKGVRELADVIEVTYSTCIWRLDRLFGEFVAEIDRAGLRDSCLLAFTSDHGEALYRKNILYPWTHGLQLAPEEIGVPLIVRAPGLGLAPGTYPGVTRSIDVMPTLAGLAGIAAGAAVEGVDLAPVLRGEAPAPELWAYSHTTVLGPERTEPFKDLEVVTRFMPLPDAPQQMWVRIRRGDLVYKLRNLDGTRWGTQVFDLTEIPLETTDLFDPANPEHAAMSAELARYKEKLVAAWPDSIATGLPEEESLDKLKALGYAR